MDIGRPVIVTQIFLIHSAVESSTRLGRLCLLATTDVSAFARLSFFLGQFSAITSTRLTTTLTTNGLSNGVIGKSTGRDSACISDNIKVSVNVTGNNILY